MATWKDRYHAASFRGHEIFIDSQTRNGGRRLVSFEYPGRDEVEYEDLGRKRRTLNLNAYICGKEYDLSTDDFEGMLNAPGAGRLIVPTKEYDFFVVVEDYQVTETTQEGGMSRFSITFAVVEETLATPELTQQIRSPLDDLRASKVNAWDALQKSFNDNYVNNPLLKKAVNRVEAVVDLLQGMSDGIATAKLIFAPVAEFKRLKSTIDGKLIAISLGLEDFAKEFRAMMDFGTDSDSDSIPTIDQSVQSFKSFLSASSGYNITSTLEDERLVNVASAMMVVASSATALQFIPFTTLDLVQELQDLYIASIDTLMDAQLSDEEYESLADLKRASVGYMEAQKAGLQNTMKIQMVETLPSLAITDMLYASLENEEDILLRNKIRHPMFVPGGKTLSVLNNG